MSANSSDSEQEEVSSHIYRDAAGFLPFKPKAKAQKEPEQLKYNIPIIDTTTSTYKMDHSKRGLALIFNHKRFEGFLGQLKRSGTDKDCDKLQIVLEKLGFDIEVIKDGTVQQVRDKLKEVAQMDHTDSDCLWIFILTHGKNGQLYAYDNLYSIDEILYFLSFDHCKTLAGKPKLITFQACQGTNVDLGHPAQLIQRDGERIIHYSIPTRADFLLLHSSSPGYVSYRDPKEGSWFIHELCEHLKEHAFEMDIFTLMTKVAQSVAFRKRTESVDFPMKYEQQMPYFTSTLTKILKFQPFNSKNPS